MIYVLVGLSKVNEGVGGAKSKNPGKAFKMQDGHFRGTSLNVEGEAVEKVTFDFLRNTNLPQLIMGATYALSVSKGFCRIFNYYKPLQLQVSPAPYPHQPQARKADNGVEFDKTDKPTKKYQVHFQVTGCIDIEAEDEEAASTWIKETLDINISPFMPYDAGMPDVDIFQVIQHD